LVERLLPGRVRKPARDGFWIGRAQAQRCAFRGGRTLC
jgi:hypothetical protein